MKILYVVALTLFLNSCGEVNLNKYLFVRDDQEEAIDVLIFKAQKFYDEGNFEEAKSFGEKAYNLNNDNEEVRIILGYIYLALGGIDTFQLSSSLINQGKTDESEGSLALAAKNAASALSGFGSIGNVTEEEIALVGTKDTAIDEFADYPIYIELKSAQDARGLISSLNYIDKSISMACPSVNDSVKIEDDSRHEDSVCPQSSYEIKQSGKAHFLWAFGHLADAIAFNKIIQYASEGSETSNLQQRSNIASQIDQSDFANYASVMSTLASNIDEVMQTDDANSMLNAVLNGLNAANQAFGAMTGVPKNLTKSVSQALESIEAGTQTSNKSGSEVLKGQLNEKVSTELATKITQQATDDPDEFANNKDSICGTYDTISQGQGSRPEACN